MFVFVKQKTAYEMRSSDWRSDVCSSDLSTVERLPTGGNLQMGRSTWLQPLLAGAGLLTVAAASADAAALTGAHRFHYDHVLGTSLDVIAVGGEGAALVALGAVLAEIDRLERILSGWRADSELAGLNAANMATVSSELFAVDRKSTRLNSSH